MPGKVCKFDGCTRAAKSRGYCNTHYGRLWKYGDVNFNMHTGYRKHRLYGAWAGMVNRCTNPNNSSYHQYGARGVTVCDRWRKFENWLADMGERPEGMTLDRIDPKGPYSPENCRWATHSEQRANNTPEGRERQRAGASAGAKRRWDEWRARNDS